MAETIFNLEPQDNESFYKHLINIWEITPDAVKERFKKDQQCVLCKDCKEYIENLQRDIREAKLRKHLEPSKES